MKSWRKLVLFAVAGACLTAQADWFNWFGKRRVETLVVTGNFSKSRLLAELFQHETRQPILLISPEGAGREQLYFMPAVPEAKAIGPEKYAEFVDFLHPTRVVFLGDESYVRASYIDQIRGRYQTVVLNSRDWLDNARALGVLIQDKGIAKRYGSYFEKLDAAAGGQAVSPDRRAASAVADPLASPEMVPPVQP